MGYDSTFKTKVILTHATMWMHLDVIMLSETSQTQKGQTFYDSTSMRYPDKSNSKTKSRISFPGLEGNKCLTVTVSLGEKERVLEMDGEDVFTTM